MTLYDIFAWYIFLCFIYFIVLYNGKIILGEESYLKFASFMLKLAMFNVLVLVFYLIEHIAYKLAKRKLYAYQDGVVLMVNDIKRFGIQEEDVVTDIKGEVVLKWDTYTRNKYKILCTRPRF